MGYAKPRLGAAQDKDNIESVLSNLGFQVRIHQNLTCKNVKSILLNTSNEDHSDNDCLVVVVMSHGSDGKICAKDKAYSVECLWENFLGNDCRSLIGKPKLFFIQACRGSNYDHGVIVNSKDYTDSPSTSTDEQLNLKIPTHSDLLVMYSTYKHQKAWRNENRGSWLIQAIFQEFTENGKDLDLLTLLTGVSRRVAFNFQSYTPENKETMDMKQMPCIVSMLTKTFFFREKLSDS